MKKNLVILIILALYSTFNSPPVIFSKNKNNLSIPIEETKFERIIKKNGLSESVVFSIAQDKDGFMWFGTRSGLNRYDGSNIKVFYGEDSSNRSWRGVRSIYKDREGILWIGTTNGFIAKYNSEHENFFSIDLNNDKDCGHVTAIVENESGQLLVGTSKDGLKIYNKNNNTITHKSELIYLKSFPKKILSMLIDKDGIVFIGTDYEGLFLYDQTRNILTNFSHNSSDNKSLSNNKVECIFQDRNNNLWIGTDSGLNVFDKENKSFVVYFNETGNPLSISHNHIASICEDKYNNLWIATVGGGLNKYEKDGTFSNFRTSINDTYSLTTDLLYRVYSDKTNNLWIGSWGYGISRLDVERKNFHTISRFFQNSQFSVNNTVSSIFVSSDELIWVATRTSTGLFTFRKTKRGILNFDRYIYISSSMSNEIMNKIFEDRNSNLWLSGYYGKLIEYNRQNKKCNIYEYNHKIRVESVDVMQNQVFIGTEINGLLKFNINNRKYTPIDWKDKISEDFWIRTFVDNENNLWLGSISGKGLFRYDFNRDAFSYFKKDTNDMSSICGNVIGAINEDSKGNLLVCTDGGLNTFNKTEGNFKCFPQIHGDNIQEDKNGNLWLTNWGLVKFDPVKETTKRYNESDGLQGDEFGRGQSFKDKDGIMYFGGLNGLTYFNPDEIKDNPYIPNIVITDFQIFNESVKPSPDTSFLKKSITYSKEINLTYKESVFSFEYAALIYNNPSKNQYAYMMEGFDKDWVYCGARRNVTYTNLDPGEYTFRVKGSNNDGIWNEEGTSIKIIITPPWWQTWWFKSCGAALFFLTAGFGYKKRVNKLKKEKLAQEEYSRKLLASQEEERKRIANELHDSIAHDILILKNDVVSAMNTTKDEETKIALNKISDQSTETLNDVRNISYNLHPHQIEALGVSKAIRSMIDKVSVSTKINFISDIDNIDKIFTEVNELHVYRIIQEAVSNVMKYSDSAEAIIKISFNKELVSILISDNGKGFDVDNVEKGSLGLSGISERVKMLGGDWSIESRRGEGTLLKILVPVKP